MKILWLKNGLLHPLDSGGKIRTYNILRRLRESNTVEYITFSDTEKDAEWISLAGEYCHRVHAVAPPNVPSKDSPGYYAMVLATLPSATPVTVSYHSSPEMREKISEVISESEFDLLVADFLAVCDNVPVDLPIPKVHFSHNVEAMIWKRHRENAGDPLKKLVFAREYARVRNFERKVLNDFSFTIAVSENDRDYFSKEYGASRVDYVTTGVDTDFFLPGSEKEEPESIMFLGAMDWMPNIDAVHYFTREIYPLIKRELPGVGFKIVGRDPIDSVRKLSESDPSITVTGTVPDTRPYISAAACTVVPIRIGGGTRIKIYEMMSMGKSVVSTTIGAEGLSYVNGENILIEDDPEKYARGVIKLLRENEYRTRMGNRAREYVKANCSWEAVTRNFIELLTQAKEYDQS
jgi:sugar transferase (PEP-CTERM/EpsH1 system associated)